MGRRKQRGASLALVVLALALAVAALLALRSMTRTTDRDIDRNATLTKIARVQAALEQYAAAHQRLPCPADPTKPTSDATSGDEVATIPVVNLCTNLLNLGAVPWRTLGLKADDALDSWGVKLSYVVTNPGGLLPPIKAGGLNMTDCDKTKNGPPALNGKCADNHSTGPAQFLTGKGLLRVENDAGVIVDQLAYVIVSHGPTGQGGFLVNGAQRAASPNVRERDNAQPITTKFWALSWSGSDVEATDSKHFDDLVAYGGLSELIDRIGLGARVWPNQAIPGEVAGTRQTLDAATIGNARGSPVTPGSLGTASLVIGSLTAAVVSGPNLGFGTITLSNGQTMEGLGIATGGNAILSSTASGNTNGAFGFQFGTPVRHFGVALAGFGISGAYAERVQFTFFNISGNNFNQVGPPVPKTACLLTGDLTTLSVTPMVAQSFNAVLITPLPSTGVLGPGPTNFLVSQTIACDSTVSSCYPPMATSTPSNKC